MFVDFSRAFDLLNRNILFYKLIKQGFHGRMLDTVRNMYTKTRCKVRTGNNLSPVISNHKGVNQGGVLSPFLFRKYLCDLKDYLDKAIGIQIDSKIISYLLWADDLVLFSNSPNGLQKQLNNLFHFTCKNQLVVNATKTKIMKFGNNTEIDVTFTINGNKVDIVQEYKYLRIIFSAT